MGRSQAAYTRKILPGILVSPALPDYPDGVTGLFIFDDINLVLTGNPRISLLKASNFFYNFIVIFSCAL